MNLEKPDAKFVKELPSIHLEPRLSLLAVNNLVALSTKPRQWRMVVNFFRDAVVLGIYANILGHLPAVVGPLIFTTLLCLTLYAVLLSSSGRQEQSLALTSSIIRFATIALVESPVRWIIDYTRLSALIDSGRFAEAEIVINNNFLLQKLESSTGMKSFFLNLLKCNVCDFESAIQTCEEWYQSRVAKSDSPAKLAFSMTQLAKAYLYGGKPERAREFAEKALVTFPKAGAARSSTLLTLARAKIALGIVDQVEAHLTEVTAYLSKQRDLFVVLKGETELAYAELFFCQSQLEESFKHAQTSSHIFLTCLPGHCLTEHSLNFRSLIRLEMHETPDLEAQEEVGALRLSLQTYRDEAEAAINKRTKRIAMAQEKT